MEKKQTQRRRLFPRVAALTQKNKQKTSVAEDDRPMLDLFLNMLECLKNIGMHQNHNQKTPCDRMFKKAK